jgi:Cu-Zn family superoxide dismutase
VDRRKKMRNSFKVRHLLMAFLCGSIFFFGLVVASKTHSIEVALAKLNFFVSGTEKTNIELLNANGEKIGQAVMFQTDEGVKISIQASGLTPGKHGFHIHENLIKDVDFSSAGGHFNPEGKKHGHDNPEGHHLGDLPNLEVKADGTVVAEMVATEVTMEKGKTNSILGRSLIIHAKEDDGKTDPAGDAGDRVAGGNIPD